MKVVIAIDSFKGSLSSLQAGTAAATGIYRVDPKVETVVRPLADGGEGTVQALTEGLGGRLVSVSVTGSCRKAGYLPVWHHRPNADRHYRDVGGCRYYAGTRR